MAKTAKKNPESKITSVVARQDDGNIQITFSIPFGLITSAKDEAVKHLAQDLEVPGFRKGKAPLGKAKEKISESKIIEHALSHMLPKALGEAMDEHKLKLAVYPKFELISAKDGETWQVRAVSCELPDVDLGNYKKIAEGALKSKNPKEPSREEKESIVIKALLDNIKIKIPQILVSDEADSRLSALLARIEKLGLALEAYLKSLGKSAEELRADYAKQATEAISLDLILGKIALMEKLAPSEKEVEEAYKVSEASGADSGNPESRKRIIESILMRRKAMDFLTAPR